VEELNAALLLALSQHHAVRELFAEHTWMRTLLDSLSDGVIAIDTSGYIRYLNPAAEHLTAWPQNEAIGRAIEDVYSVTNPSGERIGQSQLRKALAREEPWIKNAFSCSRAAGGRSQLRMLPQP
jgi:PAS domain S-box-containing protein